MQKAEVLFLPAYSPDFNPIEKMWSKVKQVLRGIKPRTEEELFAATATALGAITAHDAKGWVNSSGYTALQKVSCVVFDLPRQSITHFLTFLQVFHKAFFLSRRHVDADSCKKPPNQRVLSVNPGSDSI